ncbi:MAG: TlpA family protein disulfide reductase [Magnetospirillum sp.]|nr:TlpA family protein disulfide reductase [Magnetospirillum sp.]
MERRHFLIAASAVLLPLPARAVMAEQGLFVHAQAKSVPALHIRDHQARVTGLEQFRGRPLLLNLWASWCTPCVSELPALDRLKLTIEPEGIAVMALCLDRSGSTGAGRTFERLNIKNLAVHADERAAAALSVAVLPTTLLIDASGHEVARFIGPAAWDGPEAVALLRTLKAGRPLAPAMAPPLIRAGAAR